MANKVLLGAFLAGSIAHLLIIGPLYCEGAAEQEEDSTPSKPDPTTTKPPATTKPSTTASKSAGSGSGSQKKATVVLYIESLCSDTIRFFANQLKPSYSRVKNHVNIEYVPFGKASYKRNDGKLNFTCQHGPKECQGNKAMACALDALKGKQDDQTNMMFCMFAHKTPHLSGEDCAKKLGFDAAKIAACSDGPDGDELLAKHGAKTLTAKPKINFIPWITINGARSKPAYKAFGNTVCGIVGGC